MVDSDPGAHEFVRQTLKAHAKGWTLDSYRGPDSLLAALGFPSLGELIVDCGGSGESPGLSGLGAANRAVALPTADRCLDTALPDVVLMEPQWPGVLGVDCVRRLTARLRKSRLFIFTA